MPDAREAATTDYLVEVAKNMSWSPRKAFQAGWDANGVNWARMYLVAAKRAAVLEAVILEAGLPLRGMLEQGSAKADHEYEAPSPVPAPRGPYNHGKGTAGRCVDVTPAPRGPLQCVLPQGHDVDPLSMRQIDPAENRSRGE